ncbi:MAG: NUDIX hydrolase [Candidatus Omnitrophica bacterium]|nr:NUDIX hydrolase [Candidatus Omnitrophota bacterium]
MKKISKKELFKGKWIAFDETIFETKDGTQIRWESVRRLNHVTAVAIIAQMIPSKRFILIRQFRPAIDGYVLGCPAGLIEEDDQQILQELKEETGYTGKLILKSPVIKSNPGLMNSGGYVAYVHVDEKDPINQHPRQQLEPEEDISVHLVRREEMKDFFAKEQASGTHIGGGLWSLFILSDYLI